VSELSFWTAADAAELDVLCFELARHSTEHRDHCEACKPCPDYEDWRQHLEECAACRGDAPLTFGPPCPRRAQMITHGDACQRCNPCPTLTKLAEIAVDWRAGRVLKSKAAWLRRYESEREGLAA
jgi:hypothetical protein